MRVPLAPAAELLSFLKQTHGPWTERDLSKALNVNSAEATQAAAAMQLQGYAEPIARTQKWRTTEAGLAVAGTKTARLTRKAVEQALSAFRDRIQAVNNDEGAEYTVSEAVAFGDFLSQDARVQAAPSATYRHVIARERYRPIRGSQARYQGERFGTCAAKPKTVAFNWSMRSRFSSRVRSWICPSASYP
jgi:hypothetical protein